MVSGDPSKRYRRYAAECIRLAQLSRDQKEKNVLLQMAETWQRLADEAETKQTRKE
jgi:hypothetical protein